MPEQSPLRIDLRTLLESLQAVLAFLLPAIVTVGLGQQETIIVLLALGAVSVFVTRLLGKSSTDAVNELKAAVNRLMASNSVLLTDASASVKRQAEEAAAAVTAPPKDAGKPASQA